ncbi:hypothetical protein C5Y96_26915 [Blastopirellula marina]|uniref:Uncharacterized protein n=1 Tax=Blastopirellula marina TaxID=124 RepID=A0A2S8EYZ7_9BACT|nr:MULTISPECIES: hypothetical protein [Pirellulaceae]PQO25133.1 hypothetical protein C5Y96_26915 [Blastopirellula marina]RCS40984.1 hypothetical protein DTL36_26960 [Bremerella cremea]
MKSLFRPQTILAAAAIMLGIAAIIMAMNPRSSAQPAKIDHAVDPILTSPDEVTIDPHADNFLSANYMLPGYCYANSQLTDAVAPGGFGPSENNAHKLQRELPGEGLYLLAQPTAVTKFGDNPGMRVLLVNQTCFTLSFGAADSRLHILQEAQDAEGQWHAIEYIPPVWCGNSLHHVYLKPDYYWAFPAPRYEGVLPAKLRFTMFLEDGSRIHSNEFEGSVNLEQFLPDESVQGAGDLE